jgi:hypothetical protein
MTFCTICGIPTLARVGSVKKPSASLSNFCQRAKSAPWKLSGDRESRYRLAKLSVASPGWIRAIRFDQLGFGAGQSEAMTP